MKGMNKPGVSLSVGFLVTAILVVQIMAMIINGGEFSEISLTEFLKHPDNLILALYFATLLFCVWLVRGPNNKVMYVFWCTGYITHYFLYWNGLEFFLSPEKNIYALNWLSTICILPLLMLCRYRSYLTILLIAVLIRFQIFNERAEKYFNELNTTDFEIKLRRGASIWFVIEFVFAAYLTIFALFHSLDSQDSLSKAFIASGMTNPFPAYYWVLNMVTVYFIVVIIRNSILDSKTQDISTISLLSESQKRALLNRVKPSQFDPF